MAETRKLRDGEYVEFTHGWGQLRYAFGLIKSFVQGRNHRIVYGDPRAPLDSINNPDSDSKVSTLIDQEND